MEGRAARCTRRSRRSAQSRVCRAVLLAAILGLSSLSVRGVGAATPTPSRTRPEIPPSQASWSGPSAVPRQVAAGSARGEAFRGPTVAAPLLPPNTQDLSRNMRLVGRWDGGGRGLAEAVAASGSTVYFAEGRHFKIADISDPRNPRLLGQLARPDGIIYGLAVAGDYAYLAENVSGLEIIDVHDPPTPVKVGVFPVGALDVAVSGHLAYVAAGGSLIILDVGDPSAPASLSRLEMPGYALSIAVSGTTVYVAAGEGGLRIIDASNPSAPVETGFYETSDYASDVAISGTLAFVCG